MTDAPLSPTDEAAVQLIVNTIIGRARMEEPKLASLGACRGGPTLALSDVANGVEAECVVCGMIVRADQVEHPVLGFKARCEGK